MNRETRVLTVGMILLCLICFYAGYVTAVTRIGARFPAVVAADH